MAGFEIMSEPHAMVKLTNGSFKEPDVSSEAIPKMIVGRSGTYQLQAPRDLQSTL